jgi:RNA polymerase sigma factor (sigma-70 family)
VQEKAPSGNSLNTVANSHPSSTRNLSPELDSGIDWSRALTEHEHWLRTVIFSRVGQRHAVDEVFQEVALAAVRQSAPLRELTKAAPWLYRIALTQCLLFRRKMGRGRKLIANYQTKCPVSEHDPTNHDPLVWLLSEERQRLVRQGLLKLASRDREILLLKYTENWSYHQLAAHLGLGHSAVEARLHRARAKLRNELMHIQVIESVEQV